MSTLGCLFLCLSCAFPGLFLARSMLQCKLLAPCRQSVWMYQYGFADVVCNGGARSGTFVLLRLQAGARREYLPWTVLVVSKTFTAKAWLGISSCYVYRLPTSSRSTPTDHSISSQVRTSSWISLLSSVSKASFLPTVPLYQSLLDFFLRH
jgi:hypothetical protein